MSISPRCVLVAACYTCTSHSCLTSVVWMYNFQKPESSCKQLWALDCCMTCFILDADTFTTLFSHTYHLPFPSDTASWSPSIIIPVSMYSNWNHHTFFLLTLVSIFPTPFAALSPVLSFAFPWGTHLSHVLSVKLLVWWWCNVSYNWYAVCLLWLASQMALPLSYARSGSDIWHRNCYLVFLNGQWISLHKSLWVQKLIWKGENRQKLN